MSAIASMQARLRRCRALCRESDDNLRLLRAESLYRAHAARFSPAYLEGCAWYVGPSLLGHLRAAGREAEAARALARWEAAGVPWATPPTAAPVPVPVPVPVPMPCAPPQAPPRPPPS